MGYLNRNMEGYGLKTLSDDYLYGTIGYLRKYLDKAIDHQTAATWADCETLAMESGNNWVWRKENTICYLFEESENPSKPGSFASDMSDYCEKKSAYMTQDTKIGDGTLSADNDFMRWECTLSNEIKYSSEVDKEIDIGHCKTLLKNLGSSFGADAFQWDSGEALLPGGSYRGTTCDLYAADLTT